MKTHVTVVPWASHRERLQGVRKTVFIDEQAVPRELEWDGQDDQATHFLAVNEAGQAIGCGRLLPTGQIGRLAVLPAFRGTGIGRALLDLAVSTASERGFERVFLHAQTHASGFYHRAGFRTSGDEFQEAGIAHVNMELVLPVPFEGSPPAQHRGGQITEHSGAPRRAKRPAAIVPAKQHEGERECLDAIITALNVPARDLAIYSQHLHAALYGPLAVQEALSRFARRARRVRVRILIHASDALVGRSRGVVDLVRRLPSRISIRVVPTELASADWSFVTWDRVGFILFADHREAVASSNLYDPVTATRLMDEFDQIWNASREDPELRQLKL